MFQARLATATEGVLAGRGFTEPMREVDLFPSTMLQMVRVGERTGGLSDQLTNSATFFEEELSYTVDELTPILRADGAPVHRCRRRVRRLGHGKRHVRPVRAVAGMSARRAHDQSGFALIEVFISIIVASLLRRGGAVALVTGIKTAEEEQPRPATGHGAQRLRRPSQGPAVLLVRQGRATTRYCELLHNELVNGGAQTQHPGPVLPAHNGVRSDESVATAVPADLGTFRS